MSLAGWITLGTLAVVGFLLATERLRPDVAGLLVLLGLSLTRVISPEQAFAGFGQPAVITILSVFILTNGLERTGMTRAIGGLILRMSGPSERKLMAVLMLTSAGLSLVMNNIAAVAVLLPTTMAIARQATMRPSRFLMPVAFGALLGGTATLLTTANLIVSNTLMQTGYLGFGLFEFAPIGVPLILVGTLVVTGLGPRLLPARDPGSELARLRRLHTELSVVYHLQEGTSTIRVQSGSPLAGATLHEGGWGHELGLTVLGISHQGRIRLAPDRNTRVEAGDLILCEGTPAPELADRYGLKLDFDSALRPTLASDEVPLVEAVLAPRSKLDGKSLKEVNFRERYGLQVLAIWRQGLVVQQNVADVPLRFGDALLIQGPRPKVELLRQDADLLVLEVETNGRPQLRAWLAAAILVVSLATAAAGILPVALALLLGATLMVLTRCLTMDEAYRAVEWRVVFLVAGMLALGVALQESGAGLALGLALSQVTLGLGGLAAAGVLTLLASATSLFIGGQTAAVLFAPIAIYAAAPLGADPRAMAMAVALGCSLAFLTPFGHPVNLLVMGPGGYSMRDYWRLGAPLTLAAFVITLLGLRWLWVL
jgi:di/tricarboxylate transporter